MSDEPSDHSQAPVDVRQAAAAARRAESERRRRVIASGDAASIKQIYIDYGNELSEAHSGDPHSVPLLSLPETGPVVVDLLRDVRGPVLDAGCGPKPAVSLELARRGSHVVAMDIAFAIAGLARAAADDVGLPLLLVVGDLEQVPFRNRAFSGVVCDDTIEHVPHDGTAAGELARVTASGGQVVVATPNRWSLPIVLAKARDTVRRRRKSADRYFVADSHLREYTRRELRALLEPHLTIRRWATVAWPGGWAKKVASALTALPGLRSFNQMLVVVATPRGRSAAQHVEETRPAG